MFCCSTPFESESFPSIELQLQINRKILPLMFLTTLLLLSSMVLHIFFTRSDWLPFLVVAFHFLDGIWNNMVMHYTLYGHVAFLSKKKSHFDMNQNQISFGLRGGRRDKETHVSNRDFFR